MKGTLKERITLGIGLGGLIGCTLLTPVVIANSVIMDRTDKAINCNLKMSELDNYTDKCRYITGEMREEEACISQKRYNASIKYEMIPAPDYLIDFSSCKKQGDTKNGN